MGLRSCSKVVEACPFLFQEMITSIFASDRLSLSPFFLHIFSWGSVAFFFVVFTTFLPQIARLSRHFFHIFSWGSVAFFFVVFMSFLPRIIRLCRHFFRNLVWICCIHLGLFVIVFCVLIGFVGNFCIFGRNLYGFFQEKLVSPMINPSRLSGFTQQKYTHFFGKWVALPHSTYGHTLYTLAKMGIFTS